MNKTREALFEQIAQAYSEYDNSYLQKGQLPMRSTEKGFWGVSNINDVYAWFCRMNFPPETRFVDLGMGDGRVVLVAALFVHATGVEIDAQLVADAKRIAQKLEIDDVTFLQQDFATIDFSSYDVLYSYADTNWEVYKEQLLSQLSGPLYLYHDTYRPYFLEKGKTQWVGQIPIYTYTKPN